MISKSKLREVFTFFSRDSKKRGEFGFVWLFAIIAGVVILLLAIYGAVKVGDDIRVQSDAELAKELTILTDPLEAGFTSSTFGHIEFNQNTRVRNVCSEGGFGENSISAKSESEIGTDYLEYTVPTTVRDKYIFSQKEDSGKIFYILSKGFNFPYKISDFIILLPDTRHYCFKDASRDVKDELKSLKIPVIHFDNCSRGDGYIMVCFGESLCDINIIGDCKNCQDIYETGVVKSADGGIVRYAGNLIYPAIFSSKDNYECNVRRLLYRGSTIATVLARKASLMNARGCATNLEPVLYGWSSALENATIDSMVELYSDAVLMEESSKWEVCGVW